MNLETFCYQSSRRVMAGLAQELHILPNVHYRPTGYNSSRVLSLRLVGVNPAYLTQVKKLRPQLTMWAGLSDEFSVRIGHDAHAIIVEVPKPKTFWQQITIEQLEQRHYLHRGPVATLGLGLQDEPRRVNFTDQAMAHVFITGATRSGKTNAQRLIAWNLARNTTPDQARFLIFDVAKNGYKWRDFDHVAHRLHAVITDVDTANRVLSWLKREIEARATRAYTQPRIFVFVDELKALLDDSDLAATYLARLASVAGEFGIHLILSTQYPQIKLLGSPELKRNVTTRLCGKVDDANAAANALGLPDSGAEALGGYGDFLLKDLESLSRLTVAHLLPHHVASLDRSEVRPLDLSADPDPAIDNGPRPGREPDPLDPAQVALALFEPMAINRLQQTLGVGGNKATRIKNFADDIRCWAIEHGHKCLPDEPSSFHSSKNGHSRPPESPKQPPSRWNGME